MQTNGKVLRVVARTEGFRRAGRVFGSEPVDIPMSELTGKEVRHMKHDPQLICIEIEVVSHIGTDDLAELRKRADIGKAFLDLLPADFQYEASPIEYVTTLEAHIHELELELATLRAAAASKADAGQGGGDEGAATGESSTHASGKRHAQGRKAAQ